MARAAGKNPEAWFGGGGVGRSGSSVSEETEDVVEAKRSTLCEAMFKLIDFEASTQGGVLQLTSGGHVLESSRKTNLFP